MALDPATLGTVAVTIKGDYSELVQAFQQAQEAAQTAGQSIAAAVGQAAAGDSTQALAAQMAGLSDAMQQAGQAGTTMAEEVAAAGGQVEAVAGQMNLFADDLQQLGQVTTLTGEQMSLFGDDAAKVGSDAAGATEPVKGLGDAVAEAGHSGETAAHVFEEFFGKLALVGGIVAAAEGLRELATEALGAYMAEEKVSISFDLMSHSSAIAEGQMAKLKETSVALAIPLDSMLSTAQRMAAAFGTGQGLTAALEGAANASAATGRSFETVAQSLERIQLTGAVSSRQLLALGVSWQQLAETMGVSIDQAQEKLKKGGQDAAKDVQVVLDTINRVYPEAAARQAAALQGQLTALKNEMEIALADVGAGLAPVVSQFADLAKTSIVPAMHDVAGAFKDLAPAVSALAKPALSTASEALDVFGVAARGVTTAVAAAKDVTSSMTPVVEAAAGAWKLVPQPIRDSIGAMDDWARSWSKLSLVFGEFGLAAAAFKKLVPELTEQLNGLRTPTLDALEESLKRNRDAFTGAAQAIAKTFVVPIDETAAALRKLIDAQNDANTALKTAAAALAQAKTAYAAGSIDLATLTRAQIAYDQALVASRPHAEGWANTVAGMQEAVRKATAEYNTHIATYEKMVALQEKGKATMLDVATAYDAASKSTNALGKSYFDAQGEATKFLVASQNQETELQKLAETFQYLTDLGADDTASMAAVKDVFEKVKTSAEKLGLTVTQVGDGIRFSVTDPSGPAAIAIQKLADEMNKLTGNVAAATTSTDGFKRGLQAIFDESGRVVGQIETLTGSIGSAQNATDSWNNSWAYGEQGWETSTDLLERVSHAIDDVAASAEAAGNAVSTLGAELDAAMGGAASGRGGRGGGGQMGLAEWLAEAAAASSPVGITPETIAQGLEAMGYTRTGNNQFDIIAPGSGYSFGGGGTGGGSAAASPAAAAVQPVIDAAAQAAAAAKEASIATSRASAQVTTSLTAVVDAAAPVTNAFAVVAQAATDASQNLVQSAATTANAFNYVTQAMTPTVSPTMGSGGLAPLHYIGPATPQSTWQPLYGGGFTGGGGGSGGGGVTVNVTGNTIASDQQAQRLASEIVTQLRTVAGLKM